MPRRSALKKESRKDVRKDAKGRKEGREEGLEEGLAKGREERNLKVAINFLQLGTPCEIVAKATGLSLEEVAKLKEEVK